jgi:hypothetical protein
MGLQYLEIFVHQMWDVKKNYQNKLDIFLLIGQTSLKNLKNRDHFVLNSKDWDRGFSVEAEKIE